MTCTRKVSRNISDSLTEKVLNEASFLRLLEGILSDGACSILLE